MAHILIAEDDTSLCQILSLALQNAGHTVQTAHDGLEGLAMLEAAGENPFDVLVTDIVMPGMDGIELSQKAVARMPAIKVIFITGFTAVAAHTQGAQPAQAETLAKPFHINSLVQRIEALLTST